MEASGLHKKLSEVTGEIGTVAKDGRNTFHNYDYVTAESLLREVRGPLTQRNVTLTPSLVDISEREYTTGKGNASVITTAKVRFVFCDADSGEQWVCDWAGQGDDAGDKGLGKAYTNAIKTFLREAFLIPTGDDPEADATTDQRAAARAPRRNGHTTYLDFLRGAIQAHAKDQFRDEQRWQALVGAHSETDEKRKELAKALEAQLEDVGGNPTLARAEYQKLGTP